MSFQPPIALFVYNRPERTREVFSCIAKQRPSQLLVVADGPKTTKPGDEAACKAVREIVSQIDWPCDVQTLFAPENMGCHPRLESGLDWVFEQVDRAIILEDDILPAPAFFYFMEKCLDTFSKDEEVIMASGRNKYVCWPEGKFSFFKSKHGSIWGWATWADRWRTYRNEFPDIGPEDGRARLEKHFADPYNVRMQQFQFEQASQERLMAWDNRWLLWGMLSEGYSLIPSQNLVQNHGFGPDATYSHTEQDFRQSLPYFNPSMEEVAASTFISSQKYNIADFDHICFLVDALTHIGSPRKAWLSYRNLENLALSPAEREEMDNLMEVFRQKEKTEKVLQHLYKYAPAQPLLQEFLKTVDRV